MHTKQKNFFTLIEMLIVIVIIGILAAALIPRLNSVQGRARNAQRKASLSQINTALYVHFSDLTKFPDQLGFLQTSGYMTTVPTDPQVATNNPCTGMNGRAQDYYMTTGYYSYGGAPLSNIAYNGFVYSKSDTLKKARVGTRLEYEGGNIAFGNDSFGPCGWAAMNNWDTNSFSKWDITQLIYNSGTNSKTGLYLYYLQ